MAHSREPPHLLELGVVLMAVIACALGGANADTMVTGSVFCDQCKEGEHSLFDYPLYGARVAMACVGSTGQMSTYKEESTNWMGSYMMRLEGSLDMSRCYARVIEGPSQCGATSGPAQGLNLMFSMFGMQMYTVNPLLSQPQQPMSICPNYSPDPQIPVPPLQRPPVGGSSGSPPRGFPFLEASACSYDKWLMPEYECHWKVVSPDTKVPVAFGPVAAGKYGTDMSLWEGLQGRGDTYRTLLREATAALLNSYNSLTFPYTTISVVSHMNWALLGDPQQALLTALRFKRANAGVSGHDSCGLSPCS